MHLWICVWGVCVCDIIWVGYYLWIGASLEVLECNLWSWKGTTTLFFGLLCPGTILDLVTVSPLHRKTRGDYHSHTRPSHSSSSLPSYSLCPLCCAIDKPNRYFQAFLILKFAERFNAIDRFSPSNVFESTNMFLTVFKHLPKEISSLSPLNFLCT